MDDDEEEVVEIKDNDSDEDVSEDIMKFWTMTTKRKKTGEELGNEGYHHLPKGKLSMY